MEGDGDVFGTLSYQRGHRSLCLGLIARGFDPGAAQVGQFVELDTVLLQGRGGGRCRTDFCLKTTNKQKRNSC